MNRGVAFECFLFLIGRLNFSFSSYGLLCLFKQNISLLPIIPKIKIKAIFLEIPYSLNQFLT